MSRRYDDGTRHWAEKTYQDTRDQYGSRLECCQAIALTVGAHVNTVVRWINETYGRPKALTSEEVPNRIRILEAEVERLRRQNHELSAYARPGGACGAGLA